MTLCFNDSVAICVLILVCISPIGECLGWSGIEALPYLSTDVDSSGDESSQV